MYLAAQVQATCGASPPGPGAGRPLLVLHPQPQKERLDQVQRHRRYRGNQGGARESLSGRGRQRKRLLRHVC